MYRKNTASQFIAFQGVDATTGGIKSGVTWTIRRCIDGTFAAGGGTVTEDSTNGWYKYAMSQADTNGNDIQFNFTGTGAVPQTINIITTAADPTDGVHFGLSALPNTAVTTNASLITSGTGTDQLQVTAGLASANEKQINGVATTSVTTVSANVGTTQPVNFNGTAGSAMVKSDTEQLATQTVTAAAGVTFPSSVASPTNITAGTITTATNLTNAPTAGDFTATMKTSLNAATPASVVGAVGSVTGAVGSVTGNVGGNVVGSVGSVAGNVTGSVGSVVGAVGSVTSPVSVAAGQIFIKKNTQLTAFTFVMTDSTTHAPSTGLTVTATRSIDGGAFGACANAVTEISGGFYKITLATTDLNGTVIALRFTAATADDKDLTIITQA